MNELERKVKEIEKELNYLRNDSPLSNEEKVEKINKLEQEKNEVIEFNNFFDNANKRIEELEKKDKLSKEERKELKELNKNINSKRKDYNKKSQGKYRDLLSAYFGQVDKRIHNRIYKNNSFWRSKNSRVNARYANVGKYFLKNLGITSAIVLVPGFVSIFIPAITPYIIGAASVYLGQTVIKTVATIYNKSKYGGPRLTREYPIAKNGYFKNIENCWGKILNNNTLSLNDIKSINKVSNSMSSEPELRTPTEEDLKPQVNNNDDILSLVSSIINSCDANNLSDIEVNRIIDLVENNNLFDKLSENIKNKYLFIKGKVNKNNVDNTTLLNTINANLEKIDISTLSKEDKDKIIKMIKDNKLEDKLNDIAHNKYYQLLSSVNTISRDENKDIYANKVKGMNDFISTIQHNKFTIQDYENMIKFVDDNDLEKGLTDINKKKYQEIKMIYNVMLKIREFDLNNFDILKAKDIVNNVRNNKITKKLNSESYRKYQKIVNKLKTELVEKTETVKETKKETNNEDLITAIKGFADIINELPRNIDECDENQLLQVINYITDHNLENHFQKYLDMFRKEYEKKKIIHTERKEDIIIDDETRRAAKFFINNPIKIRRTMPDNLKRIAILSNRIRNGVATKLEKETYLLLCQKEANIDNLYDEYRKDDGKRAK